MTKKPSKFNVEHQFEIKSVDVELLADWIISAAAVLAIQPTFKEVTMRVWGELGKKYPLDKCSKETQKGVYRFVKEFIWKTYRWR